MKLAYVVIFVVFVVISCDDLTEKINEALCQLQCYESGYSGCTITEECSCSGRNVSETDSTNYCDLYDLNLKCKTLDMFHIEWKKNSMISPAEESKTAYFLQVSNSHHEFFTEVIFCNYYSVLNVFPNESYEVTLWAISEQNISKSENLTVVTPEKGIIPYPVPNLLVDLVPNEKSYEAVVEWSPAEDLSCYYDIILYCTHSENTNHIVPAPEYFEITDPSNLFKLHIYDLHVGFSYEISIRAQSGDFEAESTNKTVEFSIPSCIETFKNLTVCEPDRPENLTIEEIEVSPAIYDIHLSWSKPTLIPDYYLAKLNIMNKSLDSNDTPILNISGEAKTASFDHIELSSYYQVHLYAVSAAGVSHPAILHRLSMHPLRIPSIQEDKYQNLKILMIILFSVASLSVLVAILFPVILRRFGHNHEKLDNSEDQSLNQSDIYGALPQVLYKVDKWRINYDDVSFKDIIGEGAFGIVWQAKIGERTVACKLLKDNATTEEARELVQEIEIMKQVGSHPNIVSMIGYISHNVQHGPILVVEYCPKGSLLSYLREIYTLIHYRLERLEEKDADEELNSVENKMYSLDWNILNTEMELTMIDIISFGRQIASGMEYLSSQKVLHRDLAARNILMVNSQIVKVSDFGLSRDVYVESVYCKKTNGKLPLRWMALESLTHQLYTTQSDVWSFGIVLWEIASLGSIPYPGIDIKDLLSILQEGERMRKPHMCPDELYSIMLNCWEDQPSDRPTFTFLRETFEKMLLEDVPYLQISFSKDS